MAVAVCVVPVLHSGTGPSNLPRPSLLSFARRLAVSASICRRMSRLGAPRRKRAPKPCGDIRLASRWVGFGSCYRFRLAGRANVPGLDGPGGKPIQAAGDIRPFQASDFSSRLRWSLVTLTLLSFKRPRFTSSIALTYMAADKATSCHLSWRCRKNSGNSLTRELTTACNLPHELSSAGEDRDGSSMPWE